MLTFLRKLRKSLIESGSTRKYLFYAVGEISLVVIGILIALQINNWNEWNKEEKLNQELYILLRESIMSDTSNFNRSIAFFEISHDNSIYLKNMILNNDPYELKIDTALIKIWNFGSPESDYKVFDRILAHGIEKIDDKVLINEIQHYYEDSRTFENIGSRTRELLRELYPKYMISWESDVATKPENWEELKGVNEFRIALDYSIYSSNRLIERTNHRKDLANFILKALEEQILVDKDQLENLPYIRTGIPRDSLY